MMKIQGKKSGKYAGFIGWFDQHDNGWDDIIVVHSDSGSYKRDKYKTIDEFNKDWEDYKESEEAEPEKALPEEELDDLWREIKNTDRLLDSLNTRVRALEKNSAEIEERLKTTEESTERLLREDNEQIIGKVKRYEPGMPQRVIFERMKQGLRDWIEKNKIDCIQTFIHTEPDGRRGVKFFDMTNAGDNQLIIIGWPTTGLVDGAMYTPDELLITGEAGKE